jgi:antitoxin component of MazEF toxin-antitoxin module
MSEIKSKRQGTVIDLTTSKAVILTQELDLLGLKIGDKVSITQMNDGKIIVEKVEK